MNDSQNYECFKSVVLK